MIDFSKTIVFRFLKVQTSGLFLKKKKNEIKKMVSAEYLSTVKPKWACKISTAEYIPRKARH